MKKVRINVDRWHVPQECQGQIVEYSFGFDVEGPTFWRRRFDRSDRTVSYDYASAEGADVEGWDPVNTVPVGIEWIPIEVDEVEVDE